MRPALLPFWLFEAAVRVDFQGRSPALAVRLSLHSLSIGIGLLA